MSGERGIFVHQFELGPMDNFIYFIGSKGSREVAVVDPAWHAPSILAEAEKLDVKITHMLCTHSYFDHVNAVEEILKSHDVPVHMLDREVEWSGFKSENLVTHAPGDRLTIGDLDIDMIHTPGHTPGCVSYKIKDGLVCGDTLFVDGCGRCDFVGGDPNVMYGTLRTLLSALPKDTVLYPGHDYGETTTSRVDTQLKTNPFLQKRTVEDFVAHRMNGKTPGTVLPEPGPWSPES